MNATPPSPGLRTLLRLRPDCALHLSGDDGATITGPNGVTSLTRLQPAVRAALVRLADGYASIEDLLAPPTGAAPGLLALHLLRRQLTGAGQLRIRLELSGRPLLTVDQLRAGGEVTAAPGTQGLVLSRFAVLRREGALMLLESPRADAEFTLHGADVVALLGTLTGEPADGGAEGGGAEAAAGAAEAAAAAAAGLPQDAAQAVLGLLAEYGFAVRPGSEEAGLALAQWSPHELWFHHRTRMGRPDRPYGGSYWAKDSHEPLPLTHPPFGGERIELPVPAAGSGRLFEVSHGEVLEARTSQRSHDDANPLTLDQLGEFLHRAARIRSRMSDGLQEISYRPYPGGGALYELEIYPVVSRVDGLAAGMYHYDPLGHALEQVPAKPSGVRQLVQLARHTGVMEQPPQVLLVVAARFGRLMWKYQNMAYAVLLKDVGALYATFYGVATGMGLAPCALGGGDAGAFATATGLDYFAESSVGEFILGSVPRQAAPPRG
ncbi:SagB family peptide dehydrogenase [Kitasatospora nipponensis]|uniref:SagB family peptide dehydrogenase n=1 Tax=Kitasatospora nipponensis TaxID=258049 RepID=A0ABP4HE18_9ACTN